MVTLLTPVPFCLEVNIAIFYSSITRLCLLKLVAWKKWGFHNALQMHKETSAGSLFWPSAWILKSVHFLCLQEEEEIYLKATYCKILINNFSVWLKKILWKHLNFTQVSRNISAFFSQLEQLSYKINYTCIFHHDANPTCQTKLKKQMLLSKNYISLSFCCEFVYTWYENYFKRTGARFLKVPVTYRAW